MQVKILRNTLAVLGIVITGTFATVTVNDASILFTNRTDYHGVNMVAYWEQNGNERSAGSSAALKNGHVQLIRFPGGVPGNSYDWENPYVNCKTNTNELWAWAQPTGANLLIETNFHLPADKAARWADTCYRKGIKVPLWEVGNEPDLEQAAALKPVWGDTAAVRNVLSEYMNAFNAQAPLIRQKYPGAVVMGPA
jgi:hypothetical protein